MPLCFSLLRRGMVYRIPRLRKYCLKSFDVYPLSPTTRLGRSRICLRDNRMVPCSIKSLATLISWLCPGVSIYVMIWPLPSTLRWIFVVKPPLLLPKASFSGVLFLPLQHVDALWLSRHLQNGFPSRFASLCLWSFATLPVFVPRSPLFSSVEIGCTRSSICHISQVYLATAPLSSAPIKSHSSLVGDPGLDGPCWVFGVVVQAPIVPIVRLSDRLGSYSIV